MLFDVINIHVKISSAKGATPDKFMEWRLFYLFLQTSKYTHMMKVKLIIESRLD